MSRWGIRLLLVLCLSLLMSFVASAQQTSGTATSQLTTQGIVSLSIKGRTISTDEAQSLEQMLVKDPSDLASRFTLISYYGTHFEEKAMKARKCEHILWTIENIPGSPLLHHFPQARLYKVDKCFVQGNELWLKQVETNKGNLDVLRNAIDYFLIPEKEIAEKFIRQGAAAEPQNPEWPQKLGQLYSLQLNSAKAEVRKQFAKDAFGQYEHALKLTTDARAQRSLRVNLARMALEAGDLTTSESLASALLTEADEEKMDGFRADILHAAHSILGRVALQNGDVLEAKRQLLASGDVQGSPVLDSFGPGMSLVKELLDRNERAVVLEYFVLISSFWKNEKLQQWTAIVKSGGTPEFGGNLSR
jgi:hypothetical protein